jgi:hypothetical protein
MVPQACRSEGGTDLEANEIVRPSVAIIWHSSIYHEVLKRWHCHENRLVILGKALVPLDLDS